MSGTTTNFKYNTNDLGQIYATYSDNTSFLSASTTTSTGFKNGTTDIGSTLVKFSEITPPSTGLTGDRGDPCGYYSNGYNNSSTDIGTYFVKKGTIRWTAAITGTPTVTRNTYSLTFNFDYVGVPTEIDVYLNGSSTSSGNYTSITSGGGSGSITVSSLSANTQYSYILSTFITGGIKTFSTTSANTYTFATITVSKSTTAATSSGGASGYSVTFGGEKESYNLYAQSSAGGTITTNGTSSLGTTTTTTLYFYVVPVDKLGIANTANGISFTIDYVPWVKPTVTVSGLNTNTATSSGVKASFSVTLNMEASCTKCRVYPGTSASGEYTAINKPNSFTGSIDTDTNYFIVPYDTNDQPGDGAGFKVTYRPWSAPTVTAPDSPKANAGSDNNATFSVSLTGTFTSCTIYTETSASGTATDTTSYTVTKSSSTSSVSFTAGSSSITSTKYYYAVPYDSNNQPGTGVNFTVTYVPYVAPTTATITSFSLDSTYKSKFNITYNLSNNNASYITLTVYGNSNYTAKFTNGIYESGGVQNTAFASTNTGTNAITTTGTNWPDDTYTLIYWVSNSVGDFISGEIQHTYSPPVVISGGGGGTGGGTTGGTTTTNYAFSMTVGDPILDNGGPDYCVNLSWTYSGYDTIEYRGYKQNTTPPNYSSHNTSDLTGKVILGGETGYYYTIEWKVTYSNDTTKSINDSKTVGLPGSTTPYSYFTNAIQSPTTGLLTITVKYINANYVCVYSNNPSTIVHNGSKTDITQTTGSKQYWDEFILITAPPYGVSSPDYIETWVSSINNVGGNYVISQKFKQNFP